MPNSLRKFVTDARAVSCTNKNGSKRISGFHDETPSDGSFLWNIWASQHICVFKYRYKKYWDTLYIVPSLDLRIAIPLIYTANTTYIYVFIHVWIPVNTLAGQNLCLLSLRTANPFPLESFPPGKNFLAYYLSTGWQLTAPHRPHKMDMINRSGTDSKSWLKPPTNANFLPVEVRLLRSSWVAP